MSVIAGIGRLRFKVDATPAVQIADVHAVKCCATGKGMFPDLRDSAGDRDACESRALAKCRPVDVCDRVNVIIVADRVRNGHISVIRIGAAGDDGVVASDVIVDVFDFQVLPGKGGRQQETQQQYGVFDELIHDEVG